MSDRHGCQAGLPGTLTPCLYSNLRIREIAFMKVVMFFPLRAFLFINHAAEKRSV